MAEPQFNIKNLARNSGVTAAALDSLDAQGQAALAQCLQMDGLQAVLEDGIKNESARNDILAAFAEPFEQLHAPEGDDDAAREALQLEALECLVHLMHEAQAAASTPLDWSLAAPSLFISHAQQDDTVEMSEDDVVLLLLGTTCANSEYADDVRALVRRLREPAAPRTEEQLEARRDAREDMQKDLVQLAEGPYLVHDKTFAAAQYNSLISYGSTWKSADDDGMGKKVPEDPHAAGQQLGYIMRPDNVPALTGVAVGMQAMVCEPKEEKYAAMNLLPVAMVGAKSYEQPVDIPALQKKSLAVLAAGGRAGVMLEGKMGHRTAMSFFGRSMQRVPDEAVDALCATTRGARETYAKSDTTGLYLARHPTEGHLMLVICVGSACRLSQRSGVKYAPTAQSHWFTMTNATRRIRGLPLIKPEKSPFLVLQTNKSFEARRKSLLQELSKRANMQVVYDPCRWSDERRKKFYAPGGGLQKWGASMAGGGWDKWRASMAARPPEEREATRKKLRETLARKTPEEREATRKKLRETLARKTPEEREATRKKLRETRGTCFDGTNWMGSSDQIECEIANMDQKRLQARFAVVYGKRTNSNNNAWLRRKLLEAAGLRPPPAPASTGRPTVHFAGASLGVQSLMALAGPRKKKAKRRPRKAAGDEGEGAQAPTQQPKRRRKTSFSRSSTAASTCAPPRARRC